MRFSDRPKAIFSYIDAQWNDPAIADITDVLVHSAMSGAVFLPDYAEQLQA